MAFAGLGLGAGAAGAQRGGGAAGGFGRVAGALAGADGGAGADEAAASRRAVAAGGVAESDAAVGASANGASGGEALEREGGSVSVGRMIARASTTTPTAATMPPATSGKTARRAGGASGMRDVVDRAAEPSVAYEPMGAGGGSDTRAVSLAIASLVGMATGAGVAAGKSELLASASYALAGGGNVEEGATLGGEDEGSLDGRSMSATRRRSAAAAIAYSIACRRRVVRSTMCWDQNCATSACVVRARASNIARSMASRMSAAVANRASGSCISARRTTPAMEGCTVGGSGTGGRPELSKCRVAR